MWEKEILKEFEQRRKQTTNKEKKTDIGKLYYKMSPGKPHGFSRGMRGDSRLSLRQNNRKNWIS